LLHTTVENYGKLDILVNNAGILFEGSVASTSTEDWQRVLDINLKSVYLCCRFAIPVMIKNGGGAIVNISSVQGLKGFYNSASYAASKGGILALTRQMAREYAGLGIRINSISPGIIFTPIFGKLVEKPTDREALFASWVNQMPVGFFGLPEDIAFAAIYLVSDESSFVTGTNLVLDGGLSIRGI
jgi:NAD(P)-dependent dehydrogenase (short-subunit alcohol dehydrogenase family)